MRKNSVFCFFFARRSAKSVKKKCFFHVFWDTLSKFAKKAFFFARRYAKSVSVLSRFSRHFVQSSQKSRKKNVFWVFSATFPKNCEETVFFTFFETLCTKFAKKGLKTAFFEWLYARSVRKQCSFTFLRHFVQSSQKMRKISVFCATLCKKCEKTVFFHVFQDTLYKVRRK